MSSKTPYGLMPFSFTRLAGREVLVNEVGDMLNAPIGTVETVVNHTIDTSGDLYKSLVANFFIRETAVPELIDVYASRLAEKKRHLEDFTSLHIFVLTLRCNQRCVYCQASSREEHSATCTMSREDMTRAVKMMFRSPSPHLTMEFQGGEPSLEPDLIEYGVTLAKEINRHECREITFVLCTNCVNLSDRVLDICKRYGIFISTSLDGPAWLHNTNRGRANSYERVTAGIARARSVLGPDAVAALMTASELALDHPEAIVDAYVENGFHSIFFRALNPYGLAQNNTDWQLYTDRFINFYKRGLDYILELNRRGVPMVEEFAAIVLRKMLTPFCTGFVDLQSPAGIINAVLVYNYDGYVYASDESRMLAEADDYTFRLGSLADDYDDIMRSAKVKEIAHVWANECLAGCSDCALRCYCGADPVRNHSTQGDMYGHRPSSLLCRKYKAIIEHIITLMIERGPEVMPIFNTWTRR